jgi:hypothetical protein
MVLTLSTIIFACGCAVDSLSFHDPLGLRQCQGHKETATAQCQETGHHGTLLWLDANVLSLIFLFSYAHAQSVANPIELNRTCNQETRGFIWFHLVLNTELMVFLVQAGGFMLSSLPSIYLVTSIMLGFSGQLFQGSKRIDTIDSLRPYYLDFN